MDPVSKHLKGLDNGVLRVFKNVVHLHFGSEGYPVIIFIGGITTGDMPTSNGCVRSAEITKETISEGGWQTCHIPGDCWVGGGGFKL